MRKPLVAGNWKMNGTRQMATSLTTEIASASEDLSSVDIVLCPPAAYLNVVGEIIGNNEVVSLGAQTVSEFDCGAYTGEIAASMLSDLGCRYVIVGHSERRQIFAETNEQVAKKFDAAQKGGMTPILCVGETREEREEGATLDVIFSQLDAIISECGVNMLANCVIAYEPVWAIGTGLTALPEQAQDVHCAIREKIAQLNSEIAESLVILYGGSVKPENAEELFAQKDIDGGLIGGAALKSEAFLTIVRAATNN